VRSNLEHNVTKDSFRDGRTDRESDEALCFWKDPVRLSRKCDVGFADGLADVPSAARIRGEEDGVASSDFECFAALRREESVTGNEVAKFGEQDLSLPNAGSALPHSSLDLTGFIFECLKALEVSHRLTDGNSDRAGVGKGNIRCTADQDWWHNVSGLKCLTQDKRIHVISKFARRGGRSQSGVLFERYGRLAAKPGAQ
jgi:hypothetical protein